MVRLIFCFSLCIALFAGQIALWRSRVPKKMKLAFALNSARVGSEIREIPSDLTRLMAAPHFTLWAKITRATVLAIENSLAENGRIIRVPSKDGPSLLNFAIKFNTGRVSKKKRDCCSLREAHGNRFRKPFLVGFRAGRIRVLEKGCKGGCPVGLALTSLDKTSSR